MSPFPILGVVSGLGFHFFFNEFLCAIRVDRNQMPRNPIYGTLGRYGLSFDLLQNCITPLLVLRDFVFMPSTCNVFLFILSK